MILAIYTHKYGADYYLLRDDEEVHQLRKGIAQEYWDRDTWTRSPAAKASPTWTGSPEQVDLYWQDKSECGLEQFETISLTYHYEKA